MRMTNYLSAFLLLLVAGLAQAADTALKPFVLAGKVAGDVASVTSDVKNKLEGAGFEVIGTYAPYDGVNILIITSDALKKHATASEFGDYGAVQRVTLSKEGDEVQIAYTNPVYMASAYRMASDMQDVADALASALGNGTPYGSEEGLSAEKLRKYHYMFAMPYFDDPLELGEFGDQAKAVNAVEDGLAKGRGGVSKVFRLDLPDGATLFGVAMTTDCSGDRFVMDKIDFKEIKSTGHLPYEMLVKNGEVYALHPKFRIAINFPDLSMAGENSFMSIMCAPGDIDKALSQVVGANPADDE